MPGRAGSRVAADAAALLVRRRLHAVVAACFGSALAMPALAQDWRLSASASATETFTTNVNFGTGGESTSDWVTSLAASVSFNRQGARAQFSGTVGASWNIYAGETQNNSIAPAVNLYGRVEAIEKFLYVEGTASATTSFISPFGPQPASVVNATANRYVSQTYSVSPYIQGVLGTTNISYLVRDDNVWTLANSFGNSSTSIPNTYGNLFKASLSYAPSPVGWTAEYLRAYYDNGIGAVGNSTDEIARLIVPYQIDPQVQVSARVGYEKYTDYQISNESSIYGFGLQWNPTDRTNIGGYWEERFFGSSYSWQISHRLPNVAISANFTRGLTSYPQLALLIPAGTTVVQFLNAAFLTRIPDPVERAAAIDQFLARTGLPPTLAAPVNFYGQTNQVQSTASLSFVLIGVRQAATFTVFNVDSNSVSGKGEELPPQLASQQDNTQTGVAVTYSYQLSGLTGLGAGVSYSRTRSNDPQVSNAQSENYNANASISTKFGPKTTGSVGVSYAYFHPVSGLNIDNSSTLNAFASITHTF